MRARTSLPGPRSWPNSSTPTCLPAGTCTCTCRCRCRPTAWKAKYKTRGKRGKDWWIWSKNSSNQCLTWSETISPVSNLKHLLFLTMLSRHHSSQNSQRLDIRKASKEAIPKKIISNFETTLKSASLSSRQPKPHPSLNNKPECGSSQPIVTSPLNRPQRHTSDSREQQRSSSPLFSSGRAYERRDNPTSPSRRKYRSSLSPSRRYERHDNFNSPLHRQDQSSFPMSGFH